jgi:hypothetical protein
MRRLSVSSDGVIVNGGARRWNGHDGIECSALLGHPIVNHFDYRLVQLPGRAVRIPLQ